jgi:hypothetical protein
MMARASVLFLLGLLSTAPTVFASDVLDTPRLFVRDASGALAAPLVQVPFEGVPDDPSLVWVVLPFGDAPARFLVGAGGVRDTNALQPLLYEGNDCGGVPLIDTPIEAGAIVDPLVLGTVVYWPNSPGTRRSVRSEGWLVTDPDQCTATFFPPNLCCVALRTAEAHEAAPAVEIVLASLRLTTAAP